jgi:hypothetical protein
VLVGLVLVTSFASTVAWGCSPLSRDYDRGTWPLHGEARAAAKEEALALLPSRAATSAAYNLVPHLTHRERIYEFPVPWRVVNWGVHGEHIDDPNRVQWLLIDRQLLNADDTSLLARLLRTEFEVRFERDDIVLAKRVHAAT